jgi:hypothetical protein
MRRLLGGVAALALFCQPAQANFTFLNASSASVPMFSFDGSTTPAGTSNCASTTECPASVPINTAGSPLFITTNPGIVGGAGASGSALVGNPVLIGGGNGTNAYTLKTDTSGDLTVIGTGTFAVQAAATLNATPSLANGNGVVPTQSGSVLSATNGSYSNLLQNNAVLSSSNPIFASLTGSTLPAFAATPTFNLGTLNGAATAANQVEAADNAAWTAGTSPFAAIGCEYTSGGATALTTGHYGVPGCTSARAQFFDLESVTGTALGTPVAWGSTPSGVVLSANVDCVAGCSSSSSITGWAGSTIGTGTIAAFGATQTTIGSGLVPAVNAYVVNTNANIEWNADGVANTTNGNPTSSLMFAYNGSTVDRLEDDANKNLKVTTTPYPATAVPITASATGTTAATTATLTNVSGHTTYICGFSVRANAAAAATGNATVTGVITGTMNYTQWTAPNASGLGVTEEVFSPCVPASAVSTSIAVVSAAPGTSGVVSVSAWGYSI